MIFNKYVFRIIFIFVYFLSCYKYTALVIGSEVNVVWDIKLPLMKQRNDVNVFSNESVMDFSFKNVPLDEALESVINKYKTITPNLKDKKIHWLIAYNSFKRFSLPKINLSFTKVTMHEALYYLAMTSKFQYRVIADGKDTLVYFNKKINSIPDRNHVFSEIFFFNKKIIKRMGIKITNKYADLKPWFEELGVELKPEAKIEFYSAHKFGQNIILLSEINYIKCSIVKSILQLLKMGIIIKTKKENNSQLIDPINCELKLRKTGFNFKFGYYSPLKKYKTLCDFVFNNVSFSNALELILDEYRNLIPRVSPFVCLKLDSLTTEKLDQTFISASLKSISLQKALELILIPTSYKYLTFGKKEENLLFFQGEALKAFGFPVVEIHPCKTNLLTFMGYKQSFKPVNLTPWFLKQGLNLPPTSKAIFSSNILQGSNCIIYISESNEDINMMKAIVWLTSNRSDGV